MVAVDLGGQRNALLLLTTQDDLAQRRRELGRYGNADVPTVQQDRTRRDTARPDVDKRACAVRDRDRPDQVVAYKTRTDRGRRAEDVGVPDRAP